MLITSCNNINEKRSGIIFEQNHIDLGTIAKNDSITCTFNYRNVSDETILINNITSSCGCTVPVSVRDSILKGDSKTIEVTFSSKYPKNIDENINVYFTGEGSPIMLFIYGIVIDSTKLN
jgi:hypothetical protein